MMAPALAGSPRVQAHRDYVIKVLLNGLTGPLDGKTYRDVMVPMGTSTDEWVAGVASYVRSSFGNSAGMVTPADVARVRERDGGPQDAVDAARARGLAAARARLAAVEADREPRRRRRRRARRRCAAGAPARRRRRACGSRSSCRSRRSSPRCSSSRHDRRAAARRRARRGAGRAGASRRSSDIREATRCRSPTDGKTWSKPVAEGKGEGPRTTITFAPTRAKFVRITQTDSAADAPAWSIRNLRIYEAPSSGRK